MVNVVSEILPPPVVLSFKDVNDTALDLVKAAPDRVFGFLTRPTLAKSFPTIKSGFDESFESTDPSELRFRFESPSSSLPAPLGSSRASFFGSFYCS